jgi:ribosome-binding protein aMBF1 (putative translation factor)
VFAGGEKSMILCDLCGERKECLQKEIDGREFDICADCWRPLEEKLKGKGRVKRQREMVVLPPQTAPESGGPKSPPGLPPKIFGAAERMN